MTKNVKLARAVAMAMTGTVLSAGGISTAAAGTVNYNAFNQGVAAPWQLVSGGNGTDGWMRTATNACGAAGNTCGAGPATSNNPAKVVAAGNVAVPWAGTDPRAAVGSGGFGYTGTQTMNWSATIGAGESVNVSKTDSITRYGGSTLSNGQTFQWADIDTAKGAWHDNNETGWAHDTDIGIFKSEVTQLVTLSIASLLPNGAIDETPDYGFTIYEGMSTLATNYNHHKAWHTMTPAEASAVGEPGAPGYSPVSGLRINDEITPLPGMFPGSGLTTGTGPFANFVQDDVVGNSTTFLAQAGQVYTIYLGGFRAGDWTETRNLYSLNIQAVPVPAAVWLFGSALAGMGVIGRRKQKATA